MEKVVHRSKDRGYFNHWWLITAHSFSFAEYYNPQRMGFWKLRVINDDTIAPDEGFWMHSHKDMEIITIPLSGSLEHTDSLWNSGVIKAWEVQVMTAGSGIRHSEYNPSSTEPVSLLQIWIMARELGVRPDYDQQDVNGLLKDRNHFHTIVGPIGNMTPLEIHQNAYISLGKIDGEKKITYSLNDESNGLYCYIIEGSAIVDGETLKKRDAIGIVTNKTVTITTLEDSYILLLEVPV